MKQEKHLFMDLKAFMCSVRDTIYYALLCTTRDRYV